MTESARPYLGDLREQLLTGIAGRRRRRRRALAGGALLAAAAAAAVPISVGGQASALAVERDGAWIELRIADATAGSAQMTRELREAGIDGEVQVVPVSPQAAGTWLAVAEYPDDVCELHPTDRLGPDPGHEGPGEVRLGELRPDGATVRVPAEFADRPHDGFFAFIAGRVAADGERAVDARAAVADYRRLRCGGGA